MKQIAASIRQFLAETGTTGSELAREAGVSPSLISLLLSGKRKDVRTVTAHSFEVAMHNLSKNHHPIPPLPIHE
jgi:transcriptional regulator with XRE-family HTH domain